MRAFGHARTEQEAADHAAVYKHPAGEAAQQRQKQKLDQDFFEELEEFIHFRFHKNASVIWMFLF
jgi:hypothetical protein